MVQEEWVYQIRRDSVNLLIYPLSAVAKKLKVSLRMMYDDTFPDGKVRKGLLWEMVELGILQKGPMPGKPRTRCWYGWEFQIDLFTQMKIQKGEPIRSRVKKTDVS
jgi:hypothetical protein